MVYVGQQEKRTSAKTNATEYIVSITFYGLYAFIGIEHLNVICCQTGVEIDFGNLVSFFGTQSVAKLPV